MINFMKYISSNFYKIFDVDGLVVYGSTLVLGGIRKDRITEY